MKADTLSYYESIVVNAVTHIAEHLDEALELEALARKAALSPLHFHRIFRGMLGETALDLHRRLRLERAAAALTNGAAPVTRIAFEAGYETHEAFTRAFGAAYAVSPSVFRRQSAAREGCSRPPETELAAANGIHFAFKDIPKLLTEGGTPMDVTIMQLDEMRVAAVRHLGPYNRISEAFGRLAEIAGKCGLYQDPRAAMIAVYYDDPDATPAAELRSDAGLVVSNDRPLPDTLCEIRIPAGRYACAAHHGAYSGLGDTWARLMGHWLPKSGHRLGTGPSFEVYRNTPENAAESDLLTELYMPILD